MRLMRVTCTPCAPSAEESARPRRSPFPDRDLHGPSLRQGQGRWYRDAVGRPPASLALLLSTAALCCSFPDYGFVPGTAAGACDDRITNGLETDTDCGGPLCGGCSDSRPCLEG